MSSHYFWKHFWRSNALAKDIYMHVFARVETSSGLIFYDQDGLKFGQLTTSMYACNSVSAGFCLRILKCMYGTNMHIQYSDLNLSKKCRQDMSPHHTFRFYSGIWKRLWSQPGKPLRQFQLSFLIFGIKGMPET